MLDETDTELVIYLARCTLARKPGDSNWLEEKAVGGLPDYICRIARAVHEDGKSISEAIAIAVGRVKTWARGGGGVTPKTRAQAAKALAEWESKKKAAKLDNKVKASHVITNLETRLTDAQLEMALKIPCTKKTNRSLLETVALAKAHKLEEAELMKLSGTVLDLLRK